MIRSLNVLVESRALISAVQASTIAQVVATQATHAGMLLANTSDHSAFRGALRVILWGIPVALSTAALIVGILKGLI